MDEASLGEKVKDNSGESEKSEDCKTGLIGLVDAKAL